MSEIELKSPAHAASVLKSKARGVKRTAETQCWKMVDQYKEEENEQGVSFWVEAVKCLLEGSEDPRVPDSEPVKRPVAA